jgi:hypothetical protein
MEENIVTETEKVSYQELTWLTTLVEQAKDWPEGQMSKLMIIDKEKAIRLMETNEDNRNLKSSVIEKINHDLVNSRYYLNGETISVSRTMRLLNGQHRLTAVIQTNIPILTWVIFGVPDEYKTTFDQGTSKTVADFLKMQRVASSKDVSIIVKLILLYAPGAEVTSKDLANRRLSNQDKLEGYEQYRNQIHYALDTFGRSKYAKVNRAIAAITASHVLISREIPEKTVDTFFDKLTGTGGNINHQDPVLWLRAKINEVLNSRVKIESSSEYKMNFILRAWNASILDKKVTRLRTPPEYPRIVKGNQINSDDIENDEFN